MNTHHPYKTNGFIYKHNKTKIKNNQQINLWNK